MSSTFVPPANGIVGGYTGHDRHILQAMTAFTAISWYNSIEIMVVVLLRFKKWSGLYFWSLEITSFAIIVYMIGAWGKMIQLTEDQLITETFNNIGWIIMIGGNSLVLYSRLHLITQNQNLLRTVLWSIIINTVILYIPTTALNYGANVDGGQAYVQGYNIMERIQMTLFSVQEFAISGVYLVEAYRFLRIAYSGDTRRLMWELVAVNAALIALDIALLSVEYEDLYEIETTLKGMVYSIKLKLELGVLSRLVKLVRHDPNNVSDSLHHSSLENGTGSGGVVNRDLSKMETTRTENSKTPWLTNPASMSARSRRTSMAFTAPPRSRQASRDLDVSMSNGSAKPDHWSSMGFVTMPESTSVEATKALQEVCAQPDPPPAVLVKRPPQSSRSSSITNMYPGRIQG